MNPDAYNPKPGIYVLEISSLGRYSTMIIDGTIAEITINDVYDKIYGKRFPFLQEEYLITEGLPIIENLRFIPYIWKDIF